MAKKVLIIGAGSGIGKEIMNELNHSGNQLYVTSRSSDKIEHHENIHFQELDVNQAFELELPELLDGLVYCPGTINLKPFHRLTEEDFLTDFKINHLGAVKVIQQALKALKNSEQASIVLFSTVAVQTGLSFHASVASSKGAIEGLSRSLAAELAPKIRVNAIAPSLTNTPLAANLLSTEQKKTANAERHPLKKVGTAKDIAKTAVYLLGEDAAWVTGQVFTIDGGIGSLR